MTAPRSASATTKRIRSSATSKQEVDPEERQVSEEGLTDVTVPGTGFRDVGSSKFNKAKWISTGTGVLVERVDRDVHHGQAAGEQLEADSKDCPMGAQPPCRVFDKEYDVAVQDAGKRYNTIRNDRGRRRSGWGCRLLLVPRAHREEARRAEGHEQEQLAGDVVGDHAVVLRGLLWRRCGGELLEVDMRGLLFLVLVSAQPRARRTIPTSARAVPVRPAEQTRAAPTAMLAKQAAARRRRVLMPRDGRRGAGRRQQPQLRRRQRARAERLDRAGVPDAGRDAEEHPDVRGSRDLPGRRQGRLLDHDHDREPEPPGS